MLTDSRWFSTLRPEAKARLNVFFFPCAGGGAQTFREWQTHLPPGVGCYLTHLPGREHRLLEPPFCYLKPLLQELGGAISAHVDTPFVFFGHSMGALIGFELARELRRRGLPTPLHLFVSACAAPQIKEWHAPLHVLGDADFIKQIYAYAQLPRELLLTPETMQLILPALRADFALCETYQYFPEDPLQCHISAFGGIEDSYVAYEGIAAWRTQTKASFTMRMFPGNHFFWLEGKKRFLQTLHNDLIRIVDNLQF